MRKHKVVDKKSDLKYLEGEEKLLIFMELLAQIKKLI